MVLGILFNRDSIYNLRKKYDKLREKTDLLKDRQKKLYILRLLDQTESTLVLLEEHDMSIFEKNRMKKMVKRSLKENKKLYNMAKKYKNQPVAPAINTKTR